MFIVDRYVLWLFTKVLVICFLCLTGLFIVIDGFGNLDEFLRYAKSTEGGLFAVLVQYYSPRILTFFDHTSPILALVAAVCAITWMQRNNELTALLAAGVHVGRIIRPLAVGVVVVSVLAVLNRELLIPGHREDLIRNAQEWLGDNAKPLRPQFDHKTDLLINGRSTLAAEQRIIEPSFQLYSTYGEYGGQLIAANAFYRPPHGKHPGGYLLDDVTVPEEAWRLPSFYATSEHSDDRQPVILSPADTPWLEKDQLFVVSGVKFSYLASGTAVCQYSSSMELFRGLRNPSLDYGSSVRVAVHARLLRPLLDVTLLFLGLPLVFTREAHNLFVAAGKCLSVVAAFLVVTLAFHGLGARGIIRPSFAAWLPLMIFAPIAYMLAGTIREADHAGEKKNRS